MGFSSRDLPNIVRHLIGVAPRPAGVSSIEFALIAPILMTLAIGLAQFGLVLNSYVELTEAVRDGARQFALSRGTSTPYSGTVSVINAAAVNLTVASLTITTSINGTACSTDSTCQTALTSATGSPATVNATYPCSLVVYGINFAPGCTLSSSTTEMIE